MRRTDSPDALQIANCELKNANWKLQISKLQGLHSEPGKLEVEEFDSDAIFILQFAICNYGMSQDS